jgi:hypothetical protein
MDNSTETPDTYPLPFCGLILIAHCAVLPAIGQDRH